MEDIIDIIVTETTNIIEITAQPNDEIIDVNIIDNREDVTLNVTPTVIEININSLTSNFGVEWGDITGTLADQTDLQNVLNLKADLVDGKVPSSQLPSYVDDVVEVATFSALPATGEIGKIYVILDTNKIYRWSGSTYIEIADSTAVWGAITGTLSNQTDLQNALNAKLNLSGGTLTGALTGTSVTLSNSLNFTSIYGGNINGYDGTSLVSMNYSASQHQYYADGTLKMMLLGNGNLLLGTTTDNGSKLQISGDATFSSSVTASSFIKSGGTSSQFLKADGSVDSSTYAKRSGLTDGYLPAWSSSLLGGSLTDSFISYASNITYVAGMGLSTLNGLDIEGNYGAGTGGLKIRSYDETTGNAYIDFANTGGRMYLGLNRSTAGGLMTNATAYATVLTTGLGTANLEFGTNATKRVTIDGTTGAVTLTSALSGTSATFSGQVNLNNNNDVYFGNVSGNGIGVYFGNSDSTLHFYNGTGGADLFKIVRSTGAATFSSSVSATSLALNGSIANSADAATLTIKQTSTSYNNGIYLERGGERNGYHMYIGGALDSLTFRRNYFGTQSDVMSLTRDGNVGIGTTAPVSKFHSVGAGEAVGGFSGSTYGIRIDSGGTYSSGMSTIHGVDTTLYGSYQPIMLNGSDVRFGTSATERMRITSGGSLQIGTTSGSGAKTLIYDNRSNSSALDESALYVRQDGSNNIQTWAGGGANERLRLTSLGKIEHRPNISDYSIAIVNSASSAYGMYMQYSGYSPNSTNFEFIYCIDSTNSKFIVWSNGSVVNRTGSYGTISDIKFKENIVDATPKLGDIAKLKVRNFNLKGENTKQIGFIAQEFEEVFPNMVDVSTEKGADGETYKSIKTSVLVPMLVKAVQELKAELDTLKNK